MDQTLTIDGRRFAIGDRVVTPFGPGVIAGFAPASMIPIAVRQDDDGRLYWWEAGEVRHA